MSSTRRLGCANRSRLGRVEEKQICSRQCPCQVQRDDGHLGPSDGQQARERAADAQVAVDGDRDHDEQRERDVARDQKLHTATTLADPDNRAGGLRALPPAGCRGQSPRLRIWGAKPPEAEVLLRSV